MNQTTNYKRNLLICFGILLLSSFTLSAKNSAPLRNQLLKHPSPYLALHGTDPVAWQSWSNKVFARAKRENKLVFVSIGYFSCHWCHVMQKESYKDKNIAATLNKYFIPVKVDRELNPALDQRLLEFVQATRGYSGWPANVFITPDGYPLVGMVYVKPKNFHAILHKLQQSWVSEPAKLGQMAKNAAKQLVKSEVSAGPDLKNGLGEKYIKSYVKISLKSADDLNGGFGQKAKFPNVPQLMALLSYIKNNNSNLKLKNFVKLTLDRMASQGLHDQLRGGFFRYAVDTQWLTPHFEKMLYDNAQLAELYLSAAKLYKNPEYEELARKTLDFIIKEMSSTSVGGFAASLSALDKKGVEGGYYLWHPKTLKKVLSKQEREVVKYAWGMEHAPHLPVGYLPVLTMTDAAVAKKLGLPKDKVAAILQQVRKKLLALQKSRKLPKDTKILAAWNGLALRTFSLAGKLKNGSKYKNVAKNIRDYIIHRLWKNGKLARSVVAGKPLGRAGLQDYAQVSLGLHTWSKLHAPEDRKLVRAIVYQAWKLFYAKQGWRLANNMVPGFAAREGMVSDGPIASPSASMIRVSWLLAKDSNDKVLMKKVRTALNVGHKALENEPWWFATHIRTLYELQLGK